MASEQRRRKNATDDRARQSEKETVAKSGARREDSGQKTSGETRSGLESVPGKFEVRIEEEKGSGGGKRTEQETKGGAGEAGGERKGGGAGGGEEAGGPSLEEISKLRQESQESSMDAIGAAEERYQKAKQLGVSALQKAKESSSRGLGDATSYATEKGAAAKDTAAQKTRQAKDVISARSTAHYAGEKAAGAKEDTIVETGKDAAKLAGEAKEKAAEATKAVAGAASKKIAADKGAVVGAEESATDYAARKKEETSHPEETSHRESEINIEADESNSRNSRSEEYDDYWEHERLIKEEQGGGGWLQAIGETIFEIGLNAKELLIGGGGTYYPGADQHGGHKGGGTVDEENHD